METELCGPEARESKRTRVQSSIANDSASREKIHQAPLALRLEVLRPEFTAVGTSSSEARHGTPGFSNFELPSGDESCTSPQDGSSTSEHATAWYKIESFSIALACILHDLNWERSICWRQDKGMITLVHGLTANAGHRRARFKNRRAWAQKWK